MFKKIIFAIVISSICTYAIEEQNIQKTTDIKIRKVLNLLKNPKLSQKQKDSETVKIIDAMFDFNTMSKISLGKKWRSFSSKQKSDFNKAFEHKIKHSYLDKLKLYNNQKVVIKKLKKPKSNRIVLETLIIGNTNTYKVVYLFYKKKNMNDWLIYDVKLVGVSIIQTYRKQFSEFLRSNSPQKLIKSL